MAKAAQVLTANRLDDGAVVYWRDGGWANTLVEAEIFAADERAKAALAAADRFVEDRVVVNPYLFPVRLDEAGIHPTEEREIIRAAGPTVRRDLGKQARHVSL